MPVVNFLVCFDEVCKKELVIALRPAHTMRLVIYNSFQSHLLVNYVFGFSIIVEKNRMIQIALCELAFSKLSIALDSFVNHQPTASNKQGLI